MEKASLSKRIRWSIEVSLFLTVSYLIAQLPCRILPLFARILGVISFRLLKRRREIAIKNIQNSLQFLEQQPNWSYCSADQLALQTFKELSLSILEDCKIYHGRGRHLVDAVEFHGFEHFEAAIAKKRGVALITAHSGNWELLALALGLKCKDGLSVLARPQDNEYLNKVIENIRKGYGNSVIYKQGALRGMFSVFKKSGIVGMLIDQAVTPDEGVLIDFLGRPAWSTKMPSLIARKCDVVRMPIFIHRELGRHIVTVYPEVPFVDSVETDVAVAQDMARLSSFIEAYVIEHPHQWYWIHNRWKRAI